jgi:hypothetical protein
MPTERPSKRPPPIKPPTPKPSWVAANIALSTVVGAASPRLLRLLYWPARAGRRGVAASVALHTAVLLGMDAIGRLAAKSARELEELKDRLRKELGRPPWPEEVARAWREEHGIPPDLDIGPPKP